jgi:hypothetical protein
MNNNNNNNKIPKIIFIIPYRNREYEKVHFSVYIKYLLEDYDVDDYQIYYIHQEDNRPFNRGAIKNIGFLIIKKLYPIDYKNITFVFNDIDTLPAKKNTFNYLTKKNQVKHFYGVNFALGGIFSIIGEDFEKTNGFPNNWGWGLEDNEMNNRVLKNNIIINRDQFYKINSKEIIHLYDDPHRIINNNEPNNYMNKKLIDNLDKITNLKYSILLNNEDTNNNKLNNNEFIANIHNFDTLINPNKGTFYKQNLEKNNNIKLNIFKPHQTTNQWSLNRFFNK